MVTYAGLTVVGGTAITALWGNMMRDAGIVPFATAADRTLAIASPNDAQLTYNSTTKWFEYYQTTPTSWLPLPGTVIARAERTTDSSTTTSEIGVLRLDSIPIVNGYSYGIKSDRHFVLSTTGDIVATMFRGNTAGNATTASTVIGAANYGTTNSVQPYSQMLSSNYMSATTGNLSVLLSVARISGTGNTKTFGAVRFRVIFEGATPADTGVDI